MSGAASYHGGLSAEEQVARHYTDRGLIVAARRWRGQAGEIDLILRDGALVVFVEVKQSRTHDAAVTHLTPRQFARIYRAAEEFIGHEPAGSLTEVRFDVALVDATGVIRVLADARPD
jgi:putative endonuclease